MADNKAEFDKIMNVINAKIQTIPDQWHEPMSDELEQFKKSAFYHNWYGRFHSLGLYGVLAIPNTTFEEWLWWFHEWAEALIDDYNQFKKDVYNALKLLQQYLDDLKKDVDLVKDKIKEIENTIHEIQQQVKQLQDEIQNVKNEIKNLKQEIQNLKQDNEGLKNALQKILQKLIDQGAWHAGDTIYNGDFNAGQSIASGTINVYGITAGGNYYIKTHAGGDHDGDIVQGLN
ncbi:hypothetical protein [Actinobacillus porcinus]|uniref:hypothetical protein n=1 Tax=Actinobacillus porcinus TaxID=51048 RepID=UPI0023547D13|nr:hypothetical protein [Actinobacillus porcinus]